MKGSSRRRYPYLILRSFASFSKVNCISRSCESNGAARRPRRVEKPFFSSFPNVANERLTELTFARTVPRFINQRRDRTAEQFLCPNVDFIVFRLMRRKKFREATGRWDLPGDDVAMMVVPLPLNEFVQLFLNYEGEPVGERCARLDRRRPVY